MAKTLTLGSANPPTVTNFCTDSCKDYCTELQSVGKKRKVTAQMHFEEFQTIILLLVRFQHKYQSAIF